MALIFHKENEKYFEVPSTIGMYWRSSKLPTEEVISIIKNGDSESSNIGGSSSHISLAKERIWGSNVHGCSEGDVRAESEGTSRHSSNNVMSQFAGDSASKYMWINVVVHIINLK